MKIVVIGGGAAGLMAAIAASTHGAEVVVCEKMEKPGRKIRITGKGRCNITNLRPWGEFRRHIHPSSDFFTRAFSTLDNAATADLLRKAGLELVAERGERLFPASGKAWSVSETLIELCRKNRVEIRCNTAVDHIVTSAGRVSGVKLANGGTFPCDAAILCTGGLSYPLTGSTGDGYAMAEALGHSISELRPSLVALRSDRPDLGRLQGLTLKNISASLIVDNEAIASEFGDLEFARGRAPGSVVTEIGGPIILRLSRAAVEALSAKKQVAIAIDLKPALNAKTLADRLRREVAALRPGEKLESLLRKFLPAQLTAPFARNIKQPLHAPAGRVPQETIAEEFKNFRLSITGHAPIDEAIVTAGGVNLPQVDPSTMQSLKTRGLYIAGEVLDLDADTGGYNLQIAFSTGYLAGKSAALGLARDRQPAAIGGGGLK